MKSNSATGFVILFLSLFFPTAITIGTASAQQWTVFDTDNSGLPHNIINSITSDTDGSKWIATNGGGMAVYDGENWTVYNTTNSDLPNNNVWVITIDDDDVKWIGTSSGLARLDGTEWTVWDYWGTPLPIQTVRTITIDAEGNKWVGGSSAWDAGGLSKFDGTDWTVYIPSNSELPSGDIRSLAIDAESNIWIGTNWDGMAVFDGNENWTVYTADDSDLPNDRVISLTIDGDNTKWIGTHGGLIRHVEEDWTVFTESNSELPNNQVWTVAIEGDSVQWIGTLSGMTRLEGADWTIYYTYTSGLPANPVRVINVDEEGLKWIGTDGGGLAIYEEGEVQDEVPAIPLLAHPVDSESDYSLSPLFIWYETARAETYQLQVSEYQNFSSATIDISDLIETTYKASGLSHETTYYWRVRAWNETGESDWSEEWSFTTHEEGPWFRIADFPGAARFEAAGFSIGDKIYVGTGKDSLSNYYKDFWEYDPATDIWTRLADFGGDERVSAVGFSIGDKGYIGSGTSHHNLFNDFWEYDPVTDIWTRIADFTGTARRSAAAFTIGDKGYVGTGHDYNDMKDFWKYNPATDTWTQIADLIGIERHYPVGFTIDDKGYIGAGQAGTDFWEYDPITNTWTERSSFLTTERRTPVGFSIDGKGYIATGDNVHEDFNDIWKYNPVKDRWVQRTDFPGSARHLAVGISTNSYGFVGLGKDLSENYFSDFWKYDPSLEPPVIEDPEPVVLASPDSGAVGISINPELTWNASERAEYYRVRLAKDPDFQTVVLDSSGIEVLSFSPQTLEYNTHYFWMVKAINIGGESHWSRPWAFFTEFGLDRPVLVGPENESEFIEAPVFLRWEPVDGAKDYIIEVSHNENFEGLLNKPAPEIAKSAFAENDINQSEWGIYFELGSVVTDTVYYWKVKAVSEQRQSDWSEVWSFNTGFAIPEVPVWEPVHEAEAVETMPLLVWSSSDRAEVYDLQLAGNPDFSEILIDVTDIPDTQYQITEELRKGVTYHWHVRAGNRSGYSDWSNPLSFTTLMPTDAFAEEIPEEFALKQNYPNPFNPSTLIRFALPEQTHVHLAVYNLLGQQVTVLVNEIRPAGRHIVTFDAGGLSSGVFIYRIEAGSYIETKQMIFVK